MTEFTDNDPIRLPESWWADLVDLLALHRIPPPARVYADRQTALWQGYGLEFDPTHIEPEPEVAPERPPRGAPSTEQDALLAGTAWGGARPEPEAPEPVVEVEQPRTIEYPELYVMFARSGLAWAPFEHLLAAQRLAHGLPELPVMAFSHTVSPPKCTQPMVLRRPPLGTEGTVFLDDDPDEVFEAIGRMIQALQDVWGPHVSMRADREQFLRAESWSAAGLERVAAARAVLQAEDVHLGSLQDQLFERLIADLSTLDLDVVPCLVHGALGPDTVRFALNALEALEVVELEGFEFAFLGDPLAEWGSVLRHGPEAVAAMLRGAGEPELLAEPQALERLRIGFDLAFINALSCDAVRWRGLEPGPRALAVHRAASGLAHHLNQDVSDLLDGVAGESSGSIHPEVAGLFRQLARCIGGLPPLALRETETLAGVVALMEIHERFGSESALGVAGDLLRSLGGRRDRETGSGTEVEPALALARAQSLPGSLLCHLTAEVVERMRDGLGPACPPAATRGAQSWLTATAAFSFQRQHMGIRYRHSALSCWCAPGESALRSAAVDLKDLLEILPPTDAIDQDLVETVVAAALEDPGAPVALLGLQRLETLALLPCPIEQALAHALRTDREALVDPVQSV